MIEVNNLTVRYGPEPVLRDVSLHVERGEWVLITGPSGCGKSTLARVLSGLIPHSVLADMDGTVKIDAADTGNMTLPQCAQRVGMLFQNPASQLFHLSVEEEVAFGPRNLNLDSREVEERVGWALEMVGIEDLRHRRPDQLSGGQKQLVALAAVLSMKPRVLVLDEPTASLDVSSTQQVMDALSRLNTREEMTIVMIEHRLHAALQEADRVYVMDDGEIAVEGIPKTVLTDPHIQKTYGLRRPIEQTMSTWGTLIQANGSRNEDQEPLLELRNVSAGYAGQEVLKDINFSLYPGEFVALVGENGVGKSTLAQVAAGLLKPQSGKVNSGNGHRPQPGLDVALLFQNPQEQLFADTVKEEVSFAPLNYDLYQEAAHERVMEEAGLQALSSRRPTNLSMGQQLRTALAASIAIQPRLVILDEPTLGQDWGHLQRLMDFVKDLNRKGTAILLITHDYKLVHHYAERVLLMEDGQIVIKGHTK